MNKNKELTENVYKACKEWAENFECELDESEKSCKQMLCYFLCRDIYRTIENIKNYLEKR